MELVENSRTKTSINEKKIMINLIIIKMMKLKMAILM